MTEIRLKELRTSAPAWTDRLIPKPDDNWSRLRRHLAEGGKWKADQLLNLASESARVLRHLPDPLAPAPFQGRGLVVGYVQSGKTANYTALIARAVDAGYRLIIILSGIHDALRNQTQARLQDELVSGSAVSGPPWTLLTEKTEDFRDPGLDILDADGPFLIVAKKITPILQRLDEWLINASSRLEHLPMLLIDDEADQASINTRGNRPPDPSLETDPDEPVRSPEGPTPTNALIRAILGRTDKAAYVAYTATPFANILVDPDGFDRKVGEDLFPRDFALQLPRPEGYVGTEELFGVSAQGRDVFQRVTDEDVSELKKAARRKSSAPLIAKPDKSVLPDTLANALLAFCIAGAIRENRPGLAGQHHTMLIHVSARVNDQTRIADAVRAQQSLWFEAMRQGHDLSALFMEAIELYYRGVDLPIQPDALALAAASILKKLEIVELNSATGENLEYDAKTAKHIVAIGGNRLSRGLTLEGLTVSYFLRTATMADTLLQMARWYGFRTGYEDLIRIWTTDGIAHWFTELSLVEQSLRDSLQALYRAGRRPSEMAIRLRAHSGLLLTARNKSGMAETVRESWSGEHPQTVILPLHDPARLQHNRILADRLIAMSGRYQDVPGGKLFRDLPPEIICDFLRSYQIHPDTIAFRGDAIADWIMQRVAEEELTEWSVLLASNLTGPVVDIGGVPIHPVTRTRQSSESIGILIDPRHEGADLPSGAESFRRVSGTYDADAMRTARSNTQGLLIVYPLSPTALGLSEPDTVIALALSLPHTHDGRSSAIVNRGVSA